jgi:hypothetical protein
MGLFDWFKKSSKKGTDISTELEKVIPYPSIPSGQPLSQAEKFVSFVESPLFKISGSFQLQIEEYTGWDDLFVTGKITEKLPGFDLRSRRKFRLCHHGFNCLIVEANKTFFIIRPTNNKKVCLEHTALETMHIQDVDEKCAILSSEHSLAYLDFNTGLVTLYQFSWRPFRIAVGKEFWLVSTRETTEGPGELYSFSSKGEYLWGLRFSEEFETAFGIIKATAYHLLISKDDKQIIVSTMDRVYRLNHNGTLISRIALADLREAEIKMEEAKRRANLPKNPQTKEELIQVMAHEMSEQLVSGMIRATSLNTPLAGFILDPITGNIFILEDSGRLTSWNSLGNLLWAYSFIEAGNYIGLLDESLVVSLKTGDIFWLNQQGETLFSAKLPKQAKAVFSIPEQDKYLIACEDGRRYELDRQTRELIQGPEGDRGMELFVFQDQIIFYDNYLWAAPPGSSWQTYQPKKTTHAALTEGRSSDDFAPQVKICKGFKKAWILSNPSAYPFHHYAIDKKNRRIYIGKRKEKLSNKERELQDKFTRTNSFSTWNEVLCYDFSLRLLWSTSFLSQIASVAVSPEGDAVFVGLWGEGLAYDPGKLIVLDANGEENLALGTVANPTAFNFENPNQGKMDVFQGPSYSVRRINTGKWKIEQDSKSCDSEISVDFGAGLDEATLGNYRIIRVGKKSYQIAYNEMQHDLKTSAAVYDAVLIPNSDNILLRIGNKTVRAISPKIETLYEIKAKGNIKAITTGGNGFLILSKEEIVFCDSDGTAKWKLGCPPNSEYNIAIWLEMHKSFFWGAGDWNYFQISLISPEGQIKKSQLFKEVPVYSYYPHVDVLADGSHFILQTCGSIECYEI